QLLDADGNILETARTNAGGHYEFLDLEPGQYTVRELQPEGYFHGGQQAGSHGGDDSANDLISGIPVGPDQQLVHYNFSEITPGSISGIVYADSNENEVFDEGEEPIEAVTVELLDADGNILETARTNAGGHYEFLDLEPGQYAVRELQPEGYFHGGQQAGSHGGDDSANDLISGIPVGPDQQLVHYNFSELTPGSISGIVYVDPNQNEVFDEGEEPIEAVTVQLLDADGNILETARTNAGGHYEFLDLEPGQYAVRELQPEEFFHGGQQAGSHGGNDFSTDLITAIAVGADEQLARYNFSELPPASISGYVFQDGHPIQTTDGNIPDKLADIRDGERKPGDRPIAGVTLELRHGLNGQPILGQQSLDGTDSEAPLTAVTDADGYYEFRGLPPGSYAVYQVHPEAYQDGIDTPGSTGGLPFNISHEPDGPFLQLLNQLRSRLAKDPGDDAIVQIPLRPGQSSVENNFSEVMVTRKIVPPTPPRPDPPSIESRELVIPPPIPLPPSIPDLPRSSPDFGYISGGSEPRMTWHLSVVNGGMPRGSRPDTNTVKGTWRTISYLHQPQWVSMTMDQGRWTLPEGTLRGMKAASESVVFGIPGGIPISGDFNGDGTSQFGVYHQGQWFIDVNGNGRWDAEDLWARLGAIEDLPIVGDWDGDGKDDIGIFGPEWRGDPHAIRAEPGLPSPQNQYPRLLRHADAPPKNLPPEPRDATDGHRVLKHTAAGSPRIDVIDHVFRFGFAGDVPVAGDWNGDGIHSIGVFRGGTWYLDVDGDGRYTDQDVIATFGELGDLPVVGDFNGDGIDQIGIYRKGTWTLDSNGNHQIDAHDEVFRLGDAKAKPVVGDWNGDGTDEPAIYRDAG
ncbi:MAG: SdrD B-like domain-containing protein, partial [Pirellulaceae bacterium]